MIKALQQDAVIAVIGAGAMGAGIAQVAAVAGHVVKVFDAREGAASQAIEKIQQQLNRLVEKGKMTAAQANEAGQRLVAVATLEDLHDASCVIEAIVENLQAKQELYAKMESIVSPACIFATNTSSISVTAIGATLQHPARLAGLHFFNPAPLMKLVEIVSGLATDKSVATCLYQTALAWGKTPVYAKSTPGFIVNRVARPFYAEGLRQLHEGVTDVVTLDTIMRQAGGFKMGPFELMDMIGLDVNFTVTNTVWNAFFQDPRFTPSLLQQEYVAAGWFGRKTGRGFYNYAQGAETPAPQFATAQTVSESIALYGEGVLVNALTQRLAGHVYEHDPIEQEDACVMTVGAARVYVSDGRTATRLAAEEDYPDVVVLDLAIDYASCTCLAVAAAQSCSQAALNQVIAVLQLAGIAVCVLKDVPGLPVIRTLSMLANEAADAVNQGVAEPDAIDTAMRLGVGYPKGPLSWANELGYGRIAEVLANMFSSYGEDRYRLSPWLEIQVCSQFLKETHDA